MLLVVSSLVIGCGAQELPPEPPPSVPTPAPTPVPTPTPTPTQPPEATPPAKTEGIEVVSLDINPNNVDNHGNSKHRRS